jgi:hypothetical protein
MEPEGSLPRPQGLTTSVYPEPAQSSPYHLSLSIYDHFISLETVMSEPALYRLLMFRVLNVISIFHSLDRLFKESAQVQGPV